MKEVTKIKTKIYFDEDDRTRFKAWCIISGLKIGEVADKLGISYDYLYAVLKGTREVTKRLKEKFRSIGYEM